MMDDGSNKTKNVMLAGIVFDATNLTEEFPKDLKVRIGTLRSASDFQLWVCYKS